MIAAAKVAAIAKRFTICLPSGASGAQESSEREREEPDHSFYVQLEHAGAASPEGDHVIEPARIRFDDSSAKVVSVGKRRFVQLGGDAPAAAGRLRDQVGVPLRVIVVLDYRPADAEIANRSGQVRGDLLEGELGRVRGGISSGFGTI
jgi:hypothetical protein